MTPMECVRCGKQSPPTDVWLPGWLCVLGCLAACSRECARAWVRENAAPEYAYDPDRHIVEPGCGTGRQP